MVSARLLPGGHRAPMAAVVMALLIAAILACAATLSVSAEVAAAAEQNLSMALENGSSDLLEDQSAVEDIEPTMMEVDAEAEAEAEMPACDGCFIEDSASASEAADADSETDDAELMEVDADLEQTLLSAHALNTEWPGFVKKIASKATSVVKKVAAPVTKAVSTVKSTATSVAKKYTSAVRTVAKKATSVVKKGASAVKKGAKMYGNAVKKGASALKKGAGKVAGAVKKGAKMYGNAIKKGASALKKGAGKVAGAVKKGAKMYGSAVKKVAGAVKNGVKKGAKMYGNAVKKVASGAKRLASKGRHMAGQLVKKAGRGIARGARALGNKAKNMGKAIGRGAKRFGKGLVKVGKDFGHAAVKTGKSIGQFAKSTAGVAKNLGKAAYHLHETVAKNAITGLKTAGSIANHARKGQWNKIDDDVKNGAKQVAKQSMSGIKKLGGDALAAAKDAEGMLQSAAATIQNFNHMVEGPVFAATNAMGIGFINGPLDAALQTFEGTMTFGATSIISGAAAADTAAHAIYKDIKTGAGWKAIGMHTLQGAAGIVSAVGPIKGGGAMHTIGEKTVKELAEKGVEAAGKAVLKSVEKTVVKKIAAPLGVSEEFIDSAYTLKGAFKGKKKEETPAPAKGDTAPAAFIESDSEDSEYTFASDLLVSEKEAREIEREIAHEDDDANNFRSFSEMSAQAVARTMDQAEIDPETLASWVAASKTDADVRAQLRAWVVQHAHETLSPAAASALAPLGLHDFPMGPEGFLFVESILGASPLNSVQLSTLRAMITKSPIHDPFEKAIQNRVVSAARRVQAVHTYMMYVLKTAVNATAANVTNTDGEEAAAEILEERAPLIQALEDSFKQARSFLQLRAKKLHVPVDLKHNKLLKKKPVIHHKYMRKRQAEKKRKAKKRAAKRAAKKAAKLRAKKERALSREQKIAQRIKELSKKEQEKLKANKERDASLKRDHMRRDITRGKSAKFRKTLKDAKKKQAADKSKQAKAKAAFKLKAARKRARKAAKRASRKAAKAAKRRHAKGNKAYKSLKARKAADALQQEIARLALEAKHLAKTESDLRNGQRPILTAHVIEDGLGDGRLEDGFTRNVQRPDRQAQKAFDAMVSAVMPEAEAVAGNIQQHNLDDSFPLMDRALKLREQFQDFKEEMKATRATPDGWPNQEHEAEEIES